MSEETKPQRQLTEAQRVARVFASQGRAPSLAEHLSSEHKQRLAALCDESGVLRKDTPQKFSAVLREIINAQKATVEGLEE